MRDVYSLPTNLLFPIIKNDDFATEGDFNNIH